MKSAAPVLLLFGLLFAPPTSSANAQDLPPLSPQAGGQSILPSALQVGDLIFSRGGSVSSKIIAWATGGGPASHVAIYVGDGFVVEAIPAEDVTLRAVDTALQGVEFAAVLRVPGLTSGDRTRIVDHAMSALGKPYDYIGAAAEARVTIAGTTYRLPVSPGDKFYCSSLVVQTFEAIGKPLAVVTGQAPNDLTLLRWFGELRYVGHLRP